MNKSFMKEAIRLSIENIKNGGGPFGAVIVRDGEIISTGVNRVTSSCDPTAHAEVSAIRAACSKLNTFVLTGCEIYSSCEPCPMCLSAIYWAHIDKLYFACKADDAKNAGFDDSFIYKEISLPLGERQLKSECAMRQEAIAAFDLWTKEPQKIKY